MAVVLIQVNDVSTTVEFYRLLTPNSHSGEDYANALCDALTEDLIINLAKTNLVALVTDGKKTYY